MINEQFFIFNSSFERTTRGREVLWGWKKEGTLFIHLFFAFSKNFRNKQHIFFANRTGGISHALEQRGTALTETSVDDSKILRRSRSMNSPMSGRLRLADVTTKHGAILLDVDGDQGRTHRNWRKRRSGSGSGSRHDQGGRDMDFHLLVDDLLFIWVKVGELHLILCVRDKVGEGSSSSNSSNVHASPLPLLI